MALIKTTMTKSSGSFCSSTRTINMLKMLTTMKMIN